jgi:stalled ribosome rescue protein Dom34
MKTVKKIEIWMDHSIAYIMEFTSNSFEIKTIESQIEGQEELTKKFPFRRKENHNEKNNLFTYYNMISETIKNYKKVILYGPKGAKMEFFDVLSEDIRFFKTKVEIKDTEELNLQQQYDFLRNHIALE